MVKRKRVRGREEDDDDFVLLTLVACVLSEHHEYPERPIIPTERFSFRTCPLSDVALFRLTEVRTTLDACRCRYNYVVHVCC